MMAVFGLIGLRPGNPYKGGGANSAKSTFIAAIPYLERAHLPPSADQKMHRPIINARTVWCFRQLE
jgi:hypothetical protein